MRSLRTHPLVRQLVRLLPYGLVAALLGTVVFFHYVTPQMRRYNPSLNAFLDRVGEDEKLARLQELQQFQKTIQEELHAPWIGRTVEVLVEGESKSDPSRLTGRTPENRIVNFTGRARPGELARVQVESATAYALGGRKIGENA